MKRILFLLAFIAVNSLCYPQGRTINKLTLEATYTFVEIKKPLRDLVDQADKPAYFEDDFFNGQLKKAIADKQYTDKEKVQVFYLMMKKLGFAFAGINYMPPKQNYLQFFTGELITLQKTRNSLRELNYNTTHLLALADSCLGSDPLLASNALLLATLLQPDNSVKALEKYSQSEVILQARNPDILNHYVCLSAALKQTPEITANLAKNILSFRTEEWIEDALCALYVRNNPVSTIREYILAETDPKNDLSIQTALCALLSKVPQATFEKSLKEFISESREKWKKELCRNILANKIPFNYSLANEEQVVLKLWNGVTLSTYSDGSLISNGSLMEFEPN